MARKYTVMEQMRGICLSLPDTKLTMTWDSPHLRVGEKIFAGCGEKSIASKLNKRQVALIAPRKSLDKFEGRVIKIGKDGRRPVRRRPSRKT